MQLEMYAKCTSGHDCRDLSVVCLKHWRAGVPWHTCCCLLSRLVHSACTSLSC